MIQPPEGSPGGFLSAELAWSDHASPPACVQMPSYPPMYSKQGGGSSGGGEVGEADGGGGDGEADGGEWLTCVSWATAYMPWATAC